MVIYINQTEKIIYLRGAQEEMWSKLLELQISPNPKEVLLWMFSHGVDKTLQSYNFQKDEILEISSLDTIDLYRWTTKIVIFWYQQLPSANPKHFVKFLNSIGATMMCNTEIFVLK